MIQMPYLDSKERNEYSRKYAKKRMAEDPNYSVGRNQLWRANSPKKYMLSRVRPRALSLGVPFDLTVEDFEIPEFCPVFPEIRLEFSMTSRRPENTPTLDRIIPDLGYVKGNVQVISMRANRLKSDASEEELRAILGYIERFKPS